MSKLFNNGETSSTVAKTCLRKGPEVTEIWLLAIIPALAWLMAKRRTRKAIVEAEDQLLHEDCLSVEDLSRFVRELSPTLRPPSKVPTANFPPTSNHVWNSPSGKRVYMN